MQHAKEISFQNGYYGKCVLSLLKDEQKLRLVLQNPSIVSRTSVGDAAGQIVSDARVVHLLNEWQHGYDMHGFGFYEVMSGDNFLGLAGFFCEKDSEGNIYPEVCCYFLEKYQGHGVGEDAAAALITYAFSLPSCTKVLADAFTDNRSTQILVKLGFERMAEQFQYKEGSKSFGQVRYELSRFNYGLKLLSQTIEKEKKNLTPRIHEMVKEDIKRTLELWYKYFNKGILLSNGGVSRCFIKPESLDNNPNLESFNMYRSDRLGSMTISPDKMKKFLIEEMAFSSRVNFHEMNLSFCLGSHEGFMRVSRCIYQKKVNDGILYPSGSYGFLASAVATMKPVEYNVSLIATNKATGGKIAHEALQEALKKSPTARTLFFELKTIAGAVYTADEVRDIILFCKTNNFFLIVDAAHHNMEFNAANKFPDVVSLCQEFDYTHYFILYTCSKVYGYERARVGFIVLGKNKKLHGMIERDLYRVIGAGGDLPFEAARILFDSPVEDRAHYLKTQAKAHQHNMNLMIAYIEGVASKNIDEEFRAKIKDSVLSPYDQGISGLKMVYKPEAGIQMKVNMSALQNKWLTNIRMFNSEIFCYSLNRLGNVVTLHSYQILDPEGFSMRYSFSVEDDVHNGMRAIHDFIKLLSDKPSVNKFMPAIDSVEDVIFATEAAIKESIKSSREQALMLRLSATVLLSQYKNNINKHLPAYAKISDKSLTLGVNNAARIIQKTWKQYRGKFFSEASGLSDLVPNTAKIGSKL